MDIKLSIKPVETKAGDIIITSDNSVNLICFDNTKYFLVNLKDGTVSGDAFVSLTDLLETTLVERLIPSDDLILALK